MTTRLGSSYHRQAGGEAVLWERCGVLQGAGVGPEANTAASMRNEALSLRSSIPGFRK